MTSILTNTAAMSALSNLTATQKSLASTQAQVSSGLAVGSASDNAAYWSIGKTMSAQVAGLQAVQQSLSLTNSIASVTAAALESVKASLQRMQADIVTAGEAGASQSAVQSDIVAQQQSIIAVANSASFNGVNWLIDHTATSQNETIVGDSDVSASDLRDIALGLQTAGSQSIYHSVRTLTTTKTDGGSTETDVSTTGQTVTKTDDGNGGVTVSPTAYDTPTGTVSGSTTVDKLIMPTGLSSSGGLMTTLFSLSPIALFSDNVSTSTTSISVSYQGAPPVVVSSSSSMDTSSSYDGYSVSAASGILDGVVLVTRSIPATASGSTNQSSGQSSPTYVFDPISGGSVLQTSSSSSYPTGATSETIEENILTMSVVDTSSSDLAQMQEMVQTALSGISKASALVGGLQNQISTQQTFNSALSDSLTSGIGSLVDADMNMASVRLQAEQTRQQLGLQALSMANQNSQLVLKLFQAA